MEWNKEPYTLNELKIEVTHDCFLQCVHCSSVALRNSRRNMGWPSCKKILHDAAVMGVREVAFSGGEPLLWPHIQDAITCASEYGMKTFLYTTGNVPNAQELLSDLCIAGLSRTMFSLFGMSANQHEEVTVVRGSYNQTLESVSHCLRVGLDTEFHFVPLPNNYKSLPKVAEQARDMGVKRISLLRLVPQGRGKNKNIELNHSENMELRKIIEALRGEGHDIRLGSPYNFLMLREKPQCRSGIDRLTIGPDLRIFPCDAFKHFKSENVITNSDYSNLGEYSLAECWKKSTLLGAVRKFLTTGFADECNSCKDLAACQSGCIAQKYYKYGELRKCPDPSCLHIHNLSRIHHI